MNSCMFTCLISHLIGLHVEYSGTVFETLSSYGIWRIHVLSCRWSFGLCRGCCVWCCVLVVVVVVVVVPSLKALRLLRLLASGILNVYGERVWTGLIWFLSTRQ
jgi:hypothetical protein